MPSGLSVYGRVGGTRIYGPSCTLGTFRKVSGRVFLQDAMTGEVVLWIDNPDLETPKIVGPPCPGPTPSTTSSPKCGQPTLLDSKGLARDTTALTSMGPTRLFDFTTSVTWALLGRRVPGFDRVGTTHGRARVALNDLNNFGKAEVPFNDEYFEDRLAEAWPF
ncbi:hypothetical protein GQ600_3044 [Phytophthora cactorum]|nr:hypothetical protein GQ600_3044 [Phytophthora cactorum]